MEIRIDKFKIAFLSLFLFTILATPLYCGNDKIVIARLKYDGGGDWYNDPEILPNLLKAYGKKFNVPTITEEVITTVKESEIYKYPIIFLTGHGNIKFSEIEREILRNYLLNGGFLYADDDYGMDKSFRREILKMFPNKTLKELPNNFSIYKFPNNFKEGVPKIHEHEKGAPIGLGIFHNGRMILYYTFNTNVSDGWADFRTHKDKKEIREMALRMGINILYYGLTN